MLEELIQRPLRSGSIFRDDNKTAFMYLTKHRPVRLVVDPYDRGVVLAPQAEKIKYN